MNGAYIPSTWVYVHLPASGVPRHLQPSQGAAPSDLSRRRSLGNRPPSLLPQTGVLNPRRRRAAGVTCGTIPTTTRRCERRLTHGPGRKGQVRAGGVDVAVQGPEDRMVDRDHPRRTP
jgi:hypothetical protein